MFERGRASPTAENTATTIRSAAAPVTDVSAATHEASSALLIVSSQFASEQREIHHRSAQLGREALKAATSGTRAQLVHENAARFVFITTAQF